VSPADPLIEPKLALTVVLPLATLVTKPLPSMAAVDGFDEVQTTAAETSCVVLSLNVPMAANCFVVPTAIVELVGVTAIETSAALVTVNDADPITEPEVALIVVLPRPTLLANPVESTIAAPVEEDDQLADVNSCVLPSSKAPIALNCCTVPRAMD